MGLRRGGRCNGALVTRSRPNPKSRSYESLFFFSSPAWSLLYSFLFRANELAVKETCIPLYNLRQAGPGCRFSIKQSLSCLSFLSPGVLIGGAVSCHAAPRAGGRHGWLWCDAHGHRRLHRHGGPICHRGAAGSRAELPLWAARSVLFSFWQREQISFCIKLN